MPPGQPNANGDIFPYQMAGGSGSNGSGDLVIHGGSPMYIGGGGGVAVSGGTIQGIGGSGRGDVSFGAPGGGALQYPTETTIRLTRPMTPEMLSRWNEIVARTRAHGFTFGSMQVPGVDSFYQRRSRLSETDPVVADINVTMVKPKYVDCTIELVKDPRRSVYSWLRDPGV